MKRLGKFNYVSAELQSNKPTFACITETWLTNNMPLTCYNIDGYTAFFNNRNDKTGGGAAIYVDNSVECRQHPTDEMSTDSFNVCAVIIGRGVKSMLLASVYRAPSCSVTDNERLCELLDS